MIAQLSSSERSKSYREWRDSNKPDLEAIASAVGVSGGGCLNTQLNRKSMNVKLRQRCIAAGIPEDVLPPATKTKAELEAELRETQIQLFLCWDALGGRCPAEISSG